MREDRVLFQCSGCHKKSYRKFIKKYQKGAYKYQADNGLFFYGNRCIKCQRLKQRKYNRTKVCKKYEKTLNGYLVRTYRNMLSRVIGILKNKAHLYKGLEILNKEEFYDWSLTNNQYLKLHKNYVKSNFELKLAPSIDRIKSKEGYYLGNMRWITFSQNSKQSSESRRSRPK